MIKRFRCIAADPPWNERGGGQITRGAQRHYELMTTSAIIETLKYSPLWLPDPEGCLLWLWATSNYLRDGFEVMDGLGFEYITHLVWVKDKIGLGQRTRQRHEHLLLGRMGKVPVPAPPDRPDSVIDELEAESAAYESAAYAAAFAGTLREAKEHHSKKPAEAYRRIERSCEGPRLECFAREQREGWTVWGNEV